MLGQIIRAARIKKGLTQARLARLAGVSRRHLAALEKGANVSVLVLKKVAAVLELTAIDLGDVTLNVTRPSAPAINLPLLAETLHEAHTGAMRTQALLARAESLFGEEKKLGVVAHFPKLVARVIDVTPKRAAGAVAEHDANVAQLGVAAEVRQGQPVRELTEGETVAIPAPLIDKGEIVFRARGDELRDVGIEDGDLLVIELRTKGRAATGELVLGKVGEEIYIGRWWQKHGEKRLMTDSRAEIAVASKRGLKVVAVINQIIRPKAK
ncbi:MAG TPA: helix-turn-helix domain-containing protein [Thermoanaerobaculia bacterium]|nr:helix-turn-helix domain-containing protein [Thermoanaerobaculia bacterium]